MRESLYPILIMVSVTAIVVYGTKHFNPQDLNKGTKGLVTKESK
jgi:hypothetical protein